MRFCAVMTAQNAPSKPEPRRQHYVPQFLLKGFATERAPGKFQLQIYDKQQDKTFASPIENAAAERDFNTVQVPEGEISWEAHLAAIENKTAPLIERVRRERSIGWITYDDKARLSVFAAVQFIRGVDYRARFVHVGKMLAARLAEDCEDITPPSNLNAEFDGRMGSLHAFNPETLLTFSTALALKHLLLLEAPSGSAFIIGDSPLAMANTKTFGPYGNLGLGIEGIQVNLPLSSELTLAFWCTSYMEEVQSKVVTMEKSLRASAGTALIVDPILRRRIETTRAAAIAPLARLRTMLAEFQAGGPRVVSVEVADGMNALQIMNAERFVMAKSADFSKAKRMIAENENFKTGLRMSVG